MPNTTPNFGLPYPAPTDAPCGFAQQWCEFTESIDAVLDTFQSGIDRSMPTIPVAMLQQTIPRGILNFQDHLFDTVVIDTAGMTDIDADPFHITIQRPGVYSMGGGITFPSPAIILNGFISVEITSTGTFPDVQNQGLDRGVGVDYHLTCYGPARMMAQGSKLGLTHSFGNQSVETITTSWLAVFWHADSMVSS